MGESGGFHTITWLKSVKRPLNQRPFIHFTLQCILLSRVTIRDSAGFHMTAQEIYANSIPTYVRIAYNRSRHP